jgi:hypothetical protein
LNGRSERKPGWELDKDIATPISRGSTNLTMGEWISQTFIEGANGTGAVDKEQLPFYGPKSTAVCWFLDAVPNLSKTVTGPVSTKVGWMAGVREYLAEHWIKTLPIVGYQVLPMMIKGLRKVARKSEISARDLQKSLGEFKYRNSFLWENAESQHNNIKVFGNLWKPVEKQLFCIL